MEARAHLRYARIAPRKVSVVLDLIRGEDLDKALAASAIWAGVRPSAVPS